MFVRTDTILDQILARKMDAVARLQDRINELADSALAAPAPRDFIGALRAKHDVGTVALIAEVKHASPSKGVLIEPFDPAALGITYATNGAAAISVLTDEPFFQGHLDHLRVVRAAVDVPALRKDFIMHEAQVFEARAAGADAVLLIVAALHDEQLLALHERITSLGMAALVEVHDETELERALAAGATLIGVNNRDLHTFREDLTTTERLAKRVPSGVTLVAESAIRSIEDVRRMGECGAHAVLVGEGLVKAGGGEMAKIGEQVRAFSGVIRDLTPNPSP